MSRRLPPPWPPHCVARESAPDTLRTGPPGLAPELPDLGDGDTIAVPLASADTLPCPRLDFDELPTLRASLAELSELARLTLPPRVRTSTAAPLLPVPRLEQPPAVRPPFVRPPDLGQTLPMARVDVAADTRPALASTPSPVAHGRPVALVDSARKPALVSTPSPLVHGRSVAPADFAARSPQRMMGPQPARPQMVASRPSRFAVALVSPARQEEGIQMMPTQLWFAPGAPLGPATPARTARRRLWAWLRSLLGLAARPRPQARGRQPGYHRQPLMRR